MITASLYTAGVKHKAWYDKKDAKIMVSDMSDGCIIASLNRCIRDKWRIAFIPIFLDELRSRGFDKTHPELFV